MIISKIPTPHDTHLCLIITDKNNLENHMVYFINQCGNLVGEVKVCESNPHEIAYLLKHMVRIHFVSDITEYIPNVHNVFKRLDSNQEVRFDDIFSWQLSPEIVEIMRRYCKMVYVLNYSNTIECEEEAHIIDDFLSKGNDGKILDLIEKAVM